MAYAITVVLHTATYTPDGPSTETSRTTQKLHPNSAYSTTTIHYDDVEAVPPGNNNEEDRWTISPSQAAANRWQIEQDAETVAMPRLQTVIDDHQAGTVTNADALQYQLWLAQHQRKIIRLVVKLLDGTG